MLAALSELSNDSTERGKFGAKAAEATQSEYQRRTNYGSLLHPLECYLRVNIRPSRNHFHSGQLEVSLHGYGRSFGAKSATISRFRFRMEVEPILGIRHLLLRYGRLLSSDKADLRMATLWLNHCESNHGSQCSEQSWSSLVKASLSLRVIDVKENCIKAVSNIHNIRFAALSYVWGPPGAKTPLLSKSNKEQIMRSG
jgi:hypothetical protein